MFAYYHKKNIIYRKSGPTELLEIYSLTNKTKNYVVPIICSPGKVFCTQKSRKSQCAPPHTQRRLTCDNFSV